MIHFRFGRIWLSDACESALTGLTQANSKPAALVMTSLRSGFGFCIHPYRYARNIRGRIHGLASYLLEDIKVCNSNLLFTVNANIDHVIRFLQFLVCLDMHCVGGCTRIHDCARGAV